MSKRWSKRQNCVHKRRESAIEYEKLDWNYDDMAKHPNGVWSMSIGNWKVRFLPPRTAVVISVLQISG